MLLIILSLYFNIIFIYIIISMYFNLKKLKKHINKMQDKLLEITKELKGEKK